MCARVVAHPRDNLPHGVGGAGAYRQFVRFWPSVVAGVVLAGAPFLAASEARAAGCCGSSHGLGDRLAPGERAAVTVGTRDVERYGTFRSDGSLHTAPDGQVDRELRADLAFATRASARLAFALSVPLLMTHKEVPSGQSGSGAGVGDVVASARYDLPVPWEHDLLTTLTFAAQLPTGKPSRRAEEPLDADMTGLGAAELRPGLVLEKTWESTWFATLGGSAGFRSGYTENDGSEVKLAPRYQLYGATGPIIGDLSISGGVVFEIEAAPRIAGVQPTDIDADRRRTSLFAYVGYDLKSSFRLAATGSFDLPIDGASKNELSSYSFGLLGRYVWTMM